MSKFKADFRDGEMRLADAQQEFAGMMQWIDLITEGRMMEPKARDQFWDLMKPNDAPTIKLCPRCSLALQLIIVDGKPVRLTRNGVNIDCYGQLYQCGCGLSLPAPKFLMGDLATAFGLGKKKRSN